MFAGANIPSNVIQLSGRRHKQCVLAYSCFTFRLRLLAVKSLVVDHLEAAP